MEIQNQEQLITLTDVSMESHPISSHQEEMKTVTEIQDWLVSYLSQVLDIPSQEISITSSWSRYGLDSATTICLASDLGDWLGRSIDPTITYSYPNLETLANHLAS
jgi:acyl carrier protein